MIDYDVMVFIRYPKEPDFADDAVVLWNEGLSAIQIIKREGYDFLRKMLIDRNRNVVTEIQLIKPRTTSMTYNGKTYHGVVAT